MSRRQAIQWVMAAVAASALPSQALAQGAVQPKIAGKGYGVDPNLLDVHKPGSFWPLTFTNAQRQTAATLADVIIPRDHLGPAASEVGVVALLDEWVSAPYPQQTADRPVILDGLAWLEDESRKRFGKAFAGISDGQRRAICDDLCSLATAPPQFTRAAAFFTLFRALCGAAYYATPEGWKAIGYVGNVPLPRFDGPPPEVLEKLGVVQTVS